MEDQGINHIEVEYKEIPMLVRLARQEDLVELRYVGNQAHVREEYRNTYKLKPNVHYLIIDPEKRGFKNYCHVTGLHTDKETIKSLFEKKLIYVIANDLENNAAFAKAKKSTTKR